MPDQAQIAQPARPDPASLLKRVKGSTRKVTPTRSWYRRCFSGCVKAEKDDELTEQLPSAQIRDFHLGDSPSSHSSRRSKLAGNLSRSGSPAQGKSPQTSRVGEYLNELPFEARPTTSFSKWFEKSQSADNQIAISTSEISLSSTLSGSGLVNEWQQPLLLAGSSGVHPNMTRQNQPGHVTTIDTPDDFNRFTSDLRGRTELESHSVSVETNKARHHRGQSHAAISVKSTEAAAELTAHPLIDSTPIPVTTTSVGPSGRGGAGQFKAYPGEIKPGNDKPDGLTDPQPPRYSWPLVDFDEELFLNSNPAQVGLVAPRRRHPKYQEPRIPSMEFSNNGLVEEVTAMLGSLDDTEKQRRQADYHERRRQRRALVHSPVSPIVDHGNGRGIHEMEASTTTTTARPQQGSVSHQQMRSATLSPVSPIQSADGHRQRVVSHQEYNWPRFSDVQEYQDPADAYSRQYRDRRRQMQRSKQLDVRTMKEEQIR
ncbi:hypothetical protein A1O1_00478 [Capronia coronata CBS 617.96]|uniref:Uncharacterized protein n=1 Tax=Capronia coronata CBS 617.96 TaxID=1182541 RepID=W9YS67_9EURO|nr:uncharacterized protein A1O1_00478 [Capronia coronata CBS 617.96]EXJ95358.1 hypothetical protein A1O1_00478 [Capronia coronata CBS 617.96]